MKSEKRTWPSPSRTQSRHTDPGRTDSRGNLGKRGIALVEFLAKVLGVNKLLDYTASGVGAIAGPMLANWKASQEGRARLTASRFDAESRLIEAQSEGNSLVIIAEAQAKARQTMDATIEAVHGVVEITRGDITQSIEFQGRKRLANVRSVVEGAAEELSNEEVPNHEPDPDWTARFFDYAQDVSSEDMQKIWARLLAGEVESPGRTSLRTLDTLRNMTKKDAEMFKDIGDFVIQGSFLFWERAFVQQYSSLNYNNFLHLQDCSLVNAIPDLVREIRWRDAKDHILFSDGGTLMLVRNQGAKETLEIPVVLLTTAGKELIRFAQCTLNQQYLQTFSEFLQSKNCQLFYLEDAVALPDGRIEYSKSKSIEPESGPSEEPTL